MDHQAFAQLLGNYGEFLGAVAVVVTLVYLSVQIRANTNEVGASHAQGAIQQLFSMAQNDQTYVPLLFKLSQGETENV